MTLDKKQAIIIKKIINKNFKLYVHQPVNNLVINFLDEFSGELKKTKDVYRYSDLVYLIQWCRKKKIENLKKTIFPYETRLGKGLIFHICPSNVPTNFIYSFFFGLLSGNSNIIKVPTANSYQKKIIIKSINKILSKKKFIKIKESNYFIQYDKNSEKEITHKISSVCDGRVIWGGDSSINEIRKFSIPERSMDISFSDRYSICIINLKELSKIKKNEIKIIANKFYYDSYSMNQQGCNSPHFLFWIGKKNVKIQKIFWQCLDEIVEKKYVFEEIQIVDKYTKLLENIVINKNIKNINLKKNNIYILDFDKKASEIENIRGVSGFFYQVNLNDLGELKKYISKKCQTATYYGYKKDEFKNFIINNNLTGVDRIVPIGNALDIDVLWDGYDLIKTLSRIISIV